MDKQQALNKFWSEASGLPAYEENAIPEDAQLPYCTYQTILDGLDYAVFPLGHIWMRSVSWGALDAIQKRIEAYIDTGKIIKMDEGNLFICKGSPFAQRVRDEEDSSIKGYLLNIQAEFLSK